MPETQIDLTTQVKGILPSINGGSGGTSIFPSQTGHQGQFLQTDGTNVSWQALDGGMF
jgi:hypothetical protein